jgi:hypothetical protein
VVSDRKGILETLVALEAPAGPATKFGCRSEGKTRVFNLGFTSQSPGAELNKSKAMPAPSSAFLNEWAVPAGHRPLFFSLLK